jgi:hypothetical protein
MERAMSSELDPASARSKYRSGGLDGGGRMTKSNDKTSKTNAILSPTEQLPYAIITIDSLPEEIEEPKRDQTIHPKAIQVCHAALLEYEIYRCHGINFVAFPEVVLKTQKKKEETMPSSFGAFFIVGLGAVNDHRHKW